MHTLFKKFTLASNLDGDILRKCGEYDIVRFENLVVMANRGRQSSPCTLHYLELTQLWFRAQWVVKIVYRKKYTSWADGHVFTGSERMQISSNQGAFLGVYVHLICHTMANYE